MLQLGCWNINGFSSQKLNDINCSKFDIFGIVESWTHGESSISFKNYTCFHQPGIKKKGKRGRRSGGIILYFKNEFKKSNAIIKIAQSKNYIFIKLDKDKCGLTHDIFLGCVYINPRAKSVCPENDKIFDSLSSLVNKYSELGKVIIMGDCNSRTANLIDYIELDETDYHQNSEGKSNLPTNYTSDLILPKRNNLDPEINEQGRMLIDFCIESKMRILNGRIDGDSLGFHTYYCPRGSSSIDYFLVSEDIFHEFVYLHVFPPNELSDHSLLWTGLKNNSNYIYSQINNNINTKDCDLLPGKYNLESGSREKFVEAVQDSKLLIDQFLLEVNNPEMDINNLSENLSNIILDSANKTFNFRPFKGKRKKKKGKQKWFNGNCKFFKRELNNLGSRLQQHPNNHDLKTSYHQLRREYKKLLKDTKKKFITDIIDKLDSLHEDNPKLFWKTINNLKKNTNREENPIPLSEMSNYLKKLYEENNTDLDISKIEIENINNKHLDYAFICKEVRDGIKKLKKNKQPGIDLIYNEFLLYGKDLLLLPIVNLFNRILSSGKFPDAWNLSCTSFLHKNGDINICDNYRCISLTSCLGKLFTSLLQKRLHKYMEENNLYNPFQAGFRPDYRTADHIFTIKTLINKYLHKLKKPIFACFVDLSKAFDSVWHSGLFKKLLNLKIGGNFYKIIKHMYSNSKFVVKKENFISEAHRANRGVRQGDGLSPLLFNIYTNDLPKIFDFSKTFPVSLITTQFNCLQYADDLILLSESEKGLQACLDSLGIYCNRWKLKVNITKTKVMIFSKGKKKSAIKFKINGQNIETVDKYKYLGMLISFNGNLKHAAEHMYNKALKAVFSLKSNILDYNYSDTKLKLKLFDSLIRPITTYGSEVWISDFTLKDLNKDNIPFEKIHNKFCKYLLGVHKKASNLASRCELGRLPIINFITKLAFKYFIRLQQLPSDRFLAEVYKVDRGLFKEGSKSWYSFIDYSCKKFKLDVKNLENENLELKIHDQTIQLIKEQLQNYSNYNSDSKLKYFSFCYTNFSLQKYLDFNIPKALCKNLTKLRISAHSLLIEKGRYHRPKIPHNSRLCQTCDLLDDEKHFILYCKKFSILRQDLFKKLNIDPSDLNKREKESTILHNIMYPLNKIDTKAICTFIEKAFELY